jgi:hypothetical protein
MEWSIGVYITLFGRLCEIIERGPTKTLSDLVVDGRECASGNRGANDALRQRSRAIPGNAMATGPAAT